MAALTLYQLQPRAGGGFHFGEEGLEQEDSRLTFPSDSLFAALTATVAVQEGSAAATAFLTPFVAGRPPFRLSSLFPYAGRLPLLPLPRLPIRAGRVPRKFAKKVRFVSPAIFRRLCAGADMAAHIDAEQDGRFLQQGAVWLSAAEQAQLPVDWRRLPAHTLTRQAVWKNDPVTRVGIDRISNTSNVYQVGRTSYNTDCGLWLAVQYDSTDSRRRVELLLHHLGDRGIGGGRTAGYGAFRLTAEPGLVPAEQWLLPESHSGRLLLSRYIPGAEEAAMLKHPAAAYRLITVGGWLQSPQHASLRRKRVKMLAAGSILPGPVRGSLVDVRPDFAGFPHPVYRSGLALTVPVVLTPEAT